MKLKTTEINSYILVPIAIFIYYISTFNLLKNDNTYMYIDSISATNIHTYDDTQFSVSMSSNKSITNTSMIHNSCNGITGTTAFSLCYTGDAVSGLSIGCVFHVECGSDNIIAITDLLDICGGGFVYYPYLDILECGVTEKRIDNNVIYTVIDDTPLLNGYTYNNITITINKTCSDNLLHIPESVYTPLSEPLYNGYFLHGFSDISIIVEETGVYDPYICGLNTNFIWKFYIDDSRVVHASIYKITADIGTPPYTFDVIIVIMSCWLVYIYTTHKANMSTTLYCSKMYIAWNICVATIFTSSFIGDVYLKNIEIIFTFDSVSGNVYVFLFLFNVWISVMMSLSCTLFMNSNSEITMYRIYIIPCLYNFVVLFSFVRYSFFPVISVVWFLYSIPSVLCSVIILITLFNALQRYRGQYIMKYIFTLYVLYIIIFISVDLFTPIMYVVKINTVIYNMLIPIFILFEINFSLYMSKYIII